MGASLIVGLSGKTMDGALLQPNISAFVDPRQTSAAMSDP
jgi:hypothetical protein